MKKYRVTLTAAERDELEQLLARGKADVRRLKHAQVLLKADQAEGGPAWPDERIVAGLDVGIATVQHLRQRFVLEGLQPACGHADDDRDRHHTNRRPARAPVSLSRWR